MTLYVLFLRYCGLEIIASIANLGVQRLVWAQDRAGMSFAMALGAASRAVLTIKKIFNQQGIFQHLDTAVQKFLLCTNKVLVSTEVIWDIATAFWLICRTDDMRKLGPDFGLRIGHFAKGKSDRRIVVTDSRLQVAK